MKKLLPPLYSQEDSPDPLVVVKYFLPDSGWTWYALEGGPEEAWGAQGLEPTGDYRFFGYVVGLEEELGYWTLSELEEVRSPRLRLKVERDLYWSPVPLSKVRRGEVR